MMEWLDGAWAQWQNLQLSELWIGLLIITAFVAGFVDAIAGGGGMIQTPMLLMAGVPPTMALGTNKIISMTGTLMAVSKYAYHRVIPIKLALLAVLPVALAAYLGTLLVMEVPENWIVFLILGSVPIALFFLLKSQQVSGKQHSVSSLKVISSTAPLAFYDGFVGPGTGTYLAIVGNRVLGLDYVRATGLAKVLNFASNLASGIAFLLAGKILWILAIPMALACLSGAYMGSHSAIKHGETFIKRVMIGMLLLILLANVIKLVIVN